MTRWLTVMVLLAAASVAFAPAARGQDGQDRPDVRRDGDGPRPGPRDGDGPRTGPREGAVRPMVVLREALGKLNLTDEQEKQIKEAIEKFAQETRPTDENRARMEELEKQFRAAREAKDEAKMRELREQMMKLRPNIEGKFRELVQEKIKPVLTDEQKRRLDAELAKARPMPPIRPELLLNNADKLNLTDDQKQKIRDLQAKFREDMGKLEGEGEENAKARRELGEKFQKDLRDLLTAEQLEQVRRLATDQGPRPPREGGDRPREGGDRPREGGDRPREGGDRPRDGGDRPPL